MGEERGGCTAPGNCSSGACLPCPETAGSDCSVSLSPHNSQKGHTQSRRRARACVVLACRVVLSYTIRARARWPQRCDNPPRNPAHPGYSFEPPCDADCMRQRPGVLDEVIIPTTLAPGAYVLGFRWDCDASSQVWQQCSDIELVE